MSVRYHGRPTLDRVTWAARAGERWLVTGPNGAGKSTLLSLVAGDHPQAFAEDVRLFGRRRGDVSVWEWKRPVGLVSGELHQYFREPLTLRQAAATGFTDTLVPRRVTPAEAATLDRLLAEFGALDFAARPFLALSAGQQRLGLIVRALVKCPPLVILDEPFQPFDADTAAHCRRWLDDNLSPEQTLLFVTHEDRDRPHTLTHELRLDAGRVAGCGPSVAE